MNWLPPRTNMDYKTQMNWLPPRTKVTLIDTASRPVLDRAVVRKLAIKKTVSIPQPNKK